MRIAAFNQLLTLQRTDPNTASIPDVYGRVQHITVERDIKAALIDMSAGDGDHGGVDVPRRVLTFRIRFRSDVSPGDVIEHRGQLYDVQSIKIIGNFRELEIVLKERK